MASEKRGRDSRTVGGGGKRDQNGKKKALKSTVRGGAARGPDMSKGERAD